MYRRSVSSLIYLTMNRPYIANALANPVRLSCRKRGKKRFLFLFLLLSDPEILMIRTVKMRPSSPLDSRRGPLDFATRLDSKGWFRDLLWGEVAWRTRCTLSRVWSGPFFTSRVVLLAFTSLPLLPLQLEKASQSPLHRSLRSLLGQGIVSFDFETGFETSLMDFGRLRKWEMARELFQSCQPILAFMASSSSRGCRARSLKRIEFISRRGDWYIQNPDACVRCRSRVSHVFIPDG